MKNPKRLNAILFSFLLLITGIALYHQLGDFAHLKNADGVLTDMRSLVLWDVRVPRIGLAILTGAGLALAGNAMQGIFQNPLASPGLLGSSAGATAAGVFLLYYFAVPFTVLLFGGVAGALASFLIVYLIAKNYGTTMMILSGLAVNMLLGSAIALLLSNADSPWALAELYRWLQGSLVWAKLDTLLISLPIALLGVACLYYERRYVDLLTFGEETAATMGVDPKRSFFITTFGAALLVGATIPQTGAIGFIGLIAPHIARILLKKRPSQLYVTSALIGALLLLAADLSVQYIPLFSHIYIGTLTAIIGAPCLIWILLTEQRRLAR
ncbi:FecCD family ABC transporter permease [Aggregatibacter aphrophilus]|uniref:Iron-uptake system permease protein FeuC n=2 Tax=Aggregatibacter aphrophilus TaxID=732 RepID=A0A336N5T5_AGGAP|nr:iron ABC transporter permease [Aggregatibacter aphrophilus]KNE86019.1 branched-chain alpha-keto acid dehydrogenase subunit E2 [Aggregatibacter aphrophilus ATCC 33389]OBY55206.1 branched-chain alpha-keto acid dehydrogenase subunit E2 [Aggregatibacter aphrophilus]RDE88194.1 iron ABC transporter permease [Aggregatibacter aphrophilus]RDE92758.1 iron ABC transporter permease [Aggregatibacter aphrophilus]SQI99112.1 Iron-uptake system permease protein FeuC [Aggregatibacter aphrophilus]